MLFEIIMIGGIFALGYRATHKKRPINVVGSLTLAAGAEHAGATGEQITHAKLTQTLDWLCGSDYYLHNGPLIIEHAPGTAFPTAEIDHLAVTPFGIFIIETKHWSGHIGVGTGADQVVRTAPDGVRESRKSPLAQNASKVAFLQRHLPPIWPVEGLGVFTSENVTLSPDLHLSLLRVADVPHWLRGRKSARCGSLPVDVDRATAAILRFTDTAPFAAERHRQRVMSSGGRPDNGSTRL